MDDAWSVPEGGGQYQADVINLSVNELSTKPRCTVNVGFPETCDLMKRLWFIVS